MKYLVAYDISDNKRRRKIFKLLKGFGYNIQKSVFEIPIDNQTIINILKTEIEKIINKDEDVVYIFPYYEKPLTNKEFENLFEREVSF
jgi:CRISPR-associated protein Cas2